MSAAEERAGLVGEPEPEAVPSRGQLNIEQTSGQPEAEESPLRGCRKVVHVTSECLHSVPVPAESVCHISVKTIQVDLQPSSQDVTATAFYRTGSDTSTATEIFKRERMTRHQATFTTAAEGELVFLFDNTYSWFNEKDVEVVVDIENASRDQTHDPPSEADAARDDDGIPLIGSFEPTSGFRPQSIDRSVSVASGSSTTTAVPTRSQNKLRNFEERTRIRRLKSEPEYQALLSQIADLTDAVKSIADANRELEARQSAQIRIIAEKVSFSA
eukprot:SAG31_NODE_642_length_13301_cov_14.143084_16_plen_272_part_00